MTRSAQGLGKFRKEDFVAVQTERAAPEAEGFATRLEEELRVHVAIVSAGPSADAKRER